MIMGVLCFSNATVSLSNIWQTSYSANTESFNTPTIIYLSNIYSASADLLAAQSSKM